MIKLKKNFLFKLFPRTQKQFLILSLDIFLLTCAFFLSIIIAEIKQLTIPKNNLFLKAITIYFLLIFLYYISMSIFGTYRTIWKFATTYNYILLIFSCILPGIIFGLIDYMSIPKEYSLKRPLVYLLIIMFSILFSTIARLAYSTYYFVNKSIKHRDKYDLKNVLIIGAGKTGSLLIGEIKRSYLNYNPIAILDDSQGKQNREIHNVPVVGRIIDLENKLNELNINLVIIAIPNLKNEQKKKIIESCIKKSIQIKVIPKIGDTISETSLLKQAKNVKIEDLLGREQKDFDFSLIHKYLNGKNVLVTGGGGTIGSELSRQIAECKINKLVILDNYENNAYDIQQELLSKHKYINLFVEIVSVADRDRMDLIFKKYKFDVVFHAAAHKHVPLMENNPESAVKNNVIGTKNMVELADKYNVSKFILISTDKAVNPTNIMGATKRLCEMIIQKQAQISKNTKFAAVRFGNVLGSNGSVIPLFKKQILQGGPVKVTHKEIIRFFMTIKEAVSLILRASTFANNEEIFILDMGEPVKILDLAENMIKLMGYKPYEDIDIVFTGLRPGEKLYEEILKSEEGLNKTSDGKIFVAKQLKVNEEELEKQINNLVEIALKNKKEEIINKMQEIVSTYKPQRKENI